MNLRCQHFISGFLYEAEQLPWETKWSLHIPCITLFQLYHYIHEMVLESLTGWLLQLIVKEQLVLQFSFVLLAINANEFLTMQNVVTVHDYRMCLSIKPRIIFHGIFFYFSSWTIIILPFNSDLFHTYFSDWENNIQIY